ncbi:SNF2-related protein [Dethiothermospora halolimnae]|uniref:SNF2-related protein n=1 Tax=Dethiothermospora halolimnae TaxID=3114390 RepID=UPI003CCBD61A
MKISRLKKHMDNWTYEKGLNYYNKNRVIGGSYDSRKNRIIGFVLGTELYEVNFNFDIYNEIKSVSCSCPYFESENRVCKHITAMYLYIENGNTIEKLNKTKEKKFSDPASMFLQQYVNVQNDRPKDTLTTLYRIHCYQDYNRLSVRLSIKLGIDRLYVIKDIPSLLDAMAKNKSLYFGQKFTFDPSSHKLSKRDKEIFDFIKELYSIQESASYKFNRNVSIINQKDIDLSENMFIKFLKLLGDTPFELHFEYDVYSNVTTDFDTIPFDIDIKSEDSDVIVDLDIDEDLIIMSDKDTLVFFKDRKLYLIDEHNKIYPFAKIYVDRHIKTIKFGNENKRNFLSYLSNFRNEPIINLSTDIKDKYIEHPLKSQLYFDKYKNGISIEVKFIYGDETINPFSKENTNPYIIRDTNKEEYIYNLLEKYGFKVYDGFLHLQNSEKIYDFFKNTVDSLKSICDIYYTDGVKNFYAENIKITNSSITSLSGGNLFDLNIDIEGFDKEEIGEILRAIKEKKKYHKLKNNKLVSLESEGVEKVDTLLEHIEKDEITDNIISLSKYRAVNVFNSMDGKDRIFFDNEDKITDIIKSIKNFDISDIIIPSNFKDILRDYQIKGYKWLNTLAHLDLGGILADDMGLGKTLQAITYIYNLKGEFPSLVIAPSSLIYNWQDEIEKFAPDINSIVISGSKDSRRELISTISSYDLVITSYPLIRRDIEFYNEYRFACCILDEAQHIKNPKSVNATSVKSINAKHRFALTGTPIENSLTELWSIFDFIMPGFLLSHGKFNEKFEKPIVQSNDNNKLNRLNKIISPFILRRKKKDVLKELPEKIETKLSCELTPKQKKIYNAYIYRIKENISKKISEDGFNKSRFEILSQITRLRQICCHPSIFIDNYDGKSGKLELLMELMDDLIGSNHKILLFSQFTSLLSIIKSNLDKKNISYNYLDGNTKVDTRLNLVNEFNKGDKNVFLISLKAGGTGLNLTSADTVIHFDPWWNPAVEAQASDRAHRIGQKNTVNVYKLITKDTIEEKIYGLQEKKKKLIDSVIKKGESFISSLNEDDIRDLFEF